MRPQAIEVSRRERCTTRVVAALVGGALLVFTVIVVGAGRFGDPRRVVPPTTASKSVDRGSFQPISAATPTVDHATLSAWRELQRESSTTDDGSAFFQALRAWAARDPRAAIDWSRTLPCEWRTSARVAALDAMPRSVDAIELGHALMQGDPVHALDFGTTVIGLLVRNHAFEAALTFACAGPTLFHEEWLTTIFSRWVKDEPDFAAEIATALQQQGVGGDTFKAIVSCWAEVSPRDAVAYAFTLPAGDERRTATQTGLSHWAARDPAALAMMAPSFADAVDRDDALATLVLSTDRANRPTATALRWAEGIESRPLRDQALTQVLQEWATQDEFSARRYVETCPSLSASERRTLQLALVRHPVRLDPW